MKIHQKSPVRTNRKSRKCNLSIQIPTEYHWKILGAFLQDLKGYLSVDDVYVVRAIIRARNFKQYLQLDDSWGLHCIPPTADFSSFQRLKARYQIASLLKKYLPVEDSTLDAVALEKVLAAEKSCKFFNNFHVHNLLNGRDERTVELLTYARAFLEKLLGKTVPLRDVIDNTQHGPGANLDTIDGDVTPYAKYRNIPYSCTSGAISYATFMVESDERWFRALKNAFRERNSLSKESVIDMHEFWNQTINIVDHNRITFVAKNAKTSRSIAIEPALNVMLQLGVDRVIRKKLKCWGIDLDSQESNRRLAKAGSIYGNFSTIDLKAASDMISLSLCKALLPDEWYTFLMNLRSPKGLLRDGSVIQYEKLSSMGNGYTFVVESAIFSAIIYAVYKMKMDPLEFSYNAVVFGDDIIVKTEHFSDVVWALNKCGFIVNHEKTFVNGPIRESCGTDWFKGVPLRPVFLSAPPKNTIELYNDYNRCKRILSLRFAIDNSCTCATILKWIPENMKFFGPYSDDVFDSWLHTDITPLAGKDHLYHFQRVISYAKKKKFTSCHLYGDRYFFMLAHSLKQETQLPLYMRKRIKSKDGSRFTVNSKEYTVRQKPSVSEIWKTVYLDPVIVV